MSGDEIGSINAALLQMAGKIGGLESSVKTMVSTWQSQEALATQGRRDLHQKVETLRNELQVMSAQLASAMKDIAEMKPSVEAFDRVKERAAGARWAGKWVYVIGMALSGGVVWIVTNLVDIHLKR
ncbi:DUF1515 domain-containing protein [Bradyrhizobium lablabi]|uniref:DUF1515 domain-containing protein n=1 Tax=Bradyrhizobium lablabi TaxID=722472 RepID=UPI001BACF900|nr:DUF1515 domain-containing protein [Bradyrhizobium lablabi]MBR0695935.1 DUF1515 domain-containing protein [Bradyrhizobium lablabi]